MSLYLLLASHVPEASHAKQERTGSDQEPRSEGAHRCGFGDGMRETLVTKEGYGMEVRVRALSRVRLGRPQKRSKTIL